MSDNQPDQPEQLTLINVFEISARDVDSFASRWRDRLDILSSKDGFVSARLYRAASKDTRFQLVNVAQWASRADFEAAVSDDGFRRSQRASAGDAGSSVRANPGLYQMIFERNGDCCQPAPQ